MTTEAALSDQPPAPNRPAIRWVPLVLALVVGAAGFWIAPAPWTAGPAKLQVTLDGAIALDADVRLGDTTPTSYSSPDEEVSVAAAAGFPLGARIELALPLPGMVVMDNVTVALVLPDGRRELVPVVGWSDELGALSARRRAPQNAAIMLALLGLVVVLWVSEALPLFATALLVPAVVAISGIGGAVPALAPFFHPLIALFFGTFLIAEALRRVELDRRAALFLVARFGRGPRRLFAAMLGTSALLSMWMTNTGATILLLPIALAVTAPLENARFRKIVVLGIAYAATTGGVGTLVGTPGNALAVDFISSFSGERISFAGWLAYGLPLVIVFLPILAGYLWWQSGVEIDRSRMAAAREVAVQQLREAGPLGRDQWLTIAVFAGVVGLWVTGGQHGISTGIVAIGGAVALSAVGLVRADDLQQISWNALLTFGGGLALGSFLDQTGTSEWMATRLVGLSDLPDFLVVGAVAGFALVVTAFASNTASAAMLIPVALPLAAVMGIDPTSLAVVVAIATSLDYAMVIGTPPTMVAYSSKLFSAREIFERGIVLDLLGVVVLVTVVRGIWAAFGLG